MGTAFLVCLFSMSLAFRTLSARVSQGARPLVTTACFQPLKVPRAVQLSLLTKRADLTTCQTTAIDVRKNKDDKKRQMSTTTVDAAASSTPSFSEFFMSRTLVTAEVLVSKIFPAGFGWQLFSVIADSQMGLAGDSLGFYLMTGLGDGLFVLGG